MSSSHSSIFSSLVNEKKVEEKPTPKEFWLKLAITPRSFVLFDTPAEEEEAKRGSMPSIRKEEYTSYFVLGCHGSQSNEQKEVANLMKAFKETKGFTHQNKKIQDEYKITRSFPERALPKHAQTDPKVTFFCGDNYYPSGALTPNDKVFQTGFYQIYSKNMIYLAAWGNHCLNYSRWTHRFDSYGIERGANQVAHTYLDRDGKLSKKKLTYLSQPYINIKTLLEYGCQWLMPSGIYDITYKNTTFVILNSSDIAADYLEYQSLKTALKTALKEKENLNKKLFINILDPHEQKTPFTSQTLSTDTSAIATLKKDLNALQIEIDNLLKKLQQNQACWLEQLFLRLPDTRKTVVWHHPIYTPGKRSEENDTSHYLTTKQQADLKEMKIGDGLSYGSILKDILLKLKVPNAKLSFADQVLSKNSGSSVLSQIDMFHCAHEHFNLLYNTKDQPNGFKQTIAGGGGGPADKSAFRKTDDLPFAGYQGFYGPTLINFNNQGSFIESFTIDGDYWCFNDSNLTPVFNWNYFTEPKQQEAYMAIREMLLKACHKFFAFNAKSPSTPYLIKQATSLLNRLNNPAPKDIQSLFGDILKDESVLRNYIESKIPNIIDQCEKANIPICEALKSYKKIKDASQPEEDDESYSLLSRLASSFS